MLDLIDEGMFRFNGLIAAAGIAVPIIVLLLFCLLFCGDGVTEEDKQAKKVVVFALDMYTGYYGVRIYKYKDPDCFDVMWVDAIKAKEYWPGRIVYEPGWKAF